MSMPENTNTGGTFVEQLNTAVRENPFSAGLVGVGILWMLFGNRDTASLTHSLSGAARRVAGKARSVSEAAGVAARGMTDTAREAVHHATEASAEGAAESPSPAKDASRAAVELGREIGHSVQKNVAMTLEEQPLLLGVIGVGIGAGIASAFSSTNIEREFAGAAAAKVKDQFRDIASQAGHQAEEVFEDIKKEGANQGFTSASASEEFNAAADKVRATTTAAKESIITHMGT